MKVYRKVKQTKFVKAGYQGLLTIHDDGKIAASIDHKSLLLGLDYEESQSYFVITNPTTRDRTIIMDRLFDR